MKRSFFAALLVGLLICLFSPPPVNAYPASKEKAWVQDHPVTAPMVATFQSNFEFVAPEQRLTIIKVVKYRQVPGTSLSNKYRDAQIRKAIALRSTGHKQTVDRYYNKCIV